MGILDSVKSHFKSRDASEEEEFERAFREGRFPDDIDFEPLSNTGNFVAAGVEPEDPLLPDPDEGLERMGLSPQDPQDSQVSAGPGQQADDPFAAPAMPQAAAGVVPLVGGSSRMQGAGAPGVAQRGGAAPSMGRPGSAPAAGAPRQGQGQPGMGAPRQGVPGGGVPAGARGMQGAPAGSGRGAAASQGARPGTAGRPSGAAAPVSTPAGAAPRPVAEEEGVQVFERQPGRSARPTTPPQGEPFADRLRARVAAANVSGVIDDGLGRSRIATNGPAPSDTGNGKVVRPSGPARPRRSVDASADELEAELAARRRNRQGQASGAAPAQGARPSATPRRPAPAGEGRASDAQAGAPAGRFADEDAASRAPRASHEPPRDANARPASSGAGAAASTSAPAASPAGEVEPFRLPTTPIVLSPRRYDDVSQIAAGVITHHQPVVLVMRGTPSDTTRRIMDFSFGLCCGTGAQMEQIGDRVYAVVPRGTQIGDPDMAALRRQGLVRG